MKSSLIIPTYNRPRDMIRLLLNLNLQTRKPDEVIIVDASETRETRQAVKSNMDRLKYPLSYYPHEKGLTQQRNFGISRAKHEIIGFSDDDCIFEPDYLERIINIFEKDEAGLIGGASGFIFSAGASNIQTIDDYLRSDLEQGELSIFMKQFLNTEKNTWRMRMRERLESIFFLHKGKEGTFSPIRCHFYGFARPFAGMKTVDYLRGVAFYRKEVFHQVQYSHFFKGYGFAEDVHFSLQVGKHYQLVVEGEAVCYHLHAPSGRPDLFKVGYMSAINYYFIFKTYDKRSFMSYFIFWYFFSISAVLDFVPALVGKNLMYRTKLFLGRIYGAFVCVFMNSKVGKT